MTFGPGGRLDSHGPLRIVKGGGSVTKEVCVPTSSSAEDFFNKLVRGSFPALQSLQFLEWREVGTWQKPLPGFTRQRLETFSVTLLRDLPPPPPSTWFDFGRLKHFEVDICGSQLQLSRILEDLPDRLETLVIRYGSNNPFDALAPHLERFESLTTLRLLSYPGSSGPFRWPAPLPLEYFPRLRLLHLTVRDMEPQLVGGHARLETLIVGGAYLNLCSEVGSADCEVNFLVRNITELCRLLEKSPSLFPSLRYVGLYGRSSRPSVSFATKFERTHQRWIPLIYERLRAAGLQLVDEGGRQWKEEWSIEHREAMRTSDSRLDRLSVGVE